jgi:tellurite resistance protein TehA-like permease
MKKHITILGALYIACGCLHILTAMIVFSLVVGGGVLSCDEEAIAVTSAVGTAVASFLILLAAPGIIGGIGLLKWRPWSRILVLILGCLNLFSIPFGTALGIYTIWVLMDDETIELFRREKDRSNAA